MSQSDNFAGGFLAGSLFGGIIGGIVGVLVTTRLNRESNESDSFKLAQDEDQSQSGRTLQGMSEERMEIARRGLEDKIAQLNEAIDDVRQQLGGVNGHTQGETLDPTSLLDS
ncbi:MAG: hypothetical protein QNJ46_30140 [Leptolyngbyaceae cyanobacterium MO_188.B28]|nr:hypothetical protein [Leptolyngbyaceae cyanobacterium MO_188.B28]